MKKSIIGIISIFVLSVLVPQCALADVLYGNFARTIFTNAVTATNATAFKVLTVTNFPTIATTNDYYYLVCLRASDNKKEIVKVTAATNGTLTVVRGQENTVAQTFALNDRLELWITAGTLGAIQQEMFTYTDNEILKQSTVNTTNLADYCVTTNKIATNAVETFTIKDSAITTGKILDYTVASVDIASNNVLTQHILDSNVTTVKLADDNVTFGKMQEITAKTILGNMQTITANPAEVPFYDQDNMASNSATALCSQQSIKAYTDSVSNGISPYLTYYSGEVVRTGGISDVFTNSIDLSSYMTGYTTGRVLVVLSVNTKGGAVGMGVTDATNRIPVYSYTTAGGMSYTYVDTTPTNKVGFVSGVTSSSGIVFVGSGDGGDGGAATAITLETYQLLR